MTTAQDYKWADLIKSEILLKKKCRVILLDLMGQINEFAASF